MAVFLGASDWFDIQNILFTCFSDTMEFVLSTTFFSPPSTFINLNRNVSKILLSSKSKSQVLEMKPRRSANYHPTIWDAKVIESLSTPYSYDFHGSRLEELKHEVISSFASSKDNPSVQLKLIDSMQRLGVAYHFEEEIEEVLNKLVKLDAYHADLYTTALHFRLMRQHAFPITSDVFNKFKLENGKFMESLVGDVQGLLSLYDASYLGMYGEDTLEEAKNFTTEHLKSLSGRLKGNIILSYQVEQALDVPLHWRMPRIEALNFIDIYQRDDTKNLALLELAVLDYNLVQSIYQRELRELARWWTTLGFSEKLHFSRDRLMENYLWTMGMMFEPQFSKCRISLTKFVCILSAIDDIYDIYGSLDELELFTEAVKRWDTKSIEKLPDYMKICYFALFNFGNELAYDVLKEGLNVLSHIKEEWLKLCQSYLVEARWFASGYTPTLDEYLENAWISIGGHQAIVHASISQGGNTSSKDSLNYLKHGSELIYWSALITRLSDDLGTSTEESKRGDVAKSIECFMIEKDASQEEAKDHIKGLIRQAWKKLNKESVKPFLPKSFINMSLNMARTAQCIFQYGDGIGTSIGVTSDRLTSLIVEHIRIK